jgi:exopolysaccharide production protein ExoQ
MAHSQTRSAGTARSVEPWERRFIGLVFALLVLGLPHEWTQTSFTTGGSASVIIVYTPLLTLALLLGLQRRAAFMKAMWTDPLILLLVLWAVASSFWSTNFWTTGRQTIAWLLATTFAFYAVTRLELREILRLAAWLMLVGTALNLIFIVALPRWGQVVDPVDTAKSGWKGIGSNKNSLGQFSAAAVVILWMARRTFTSHRLLYTVGAIVNVVVLVGADAKTSLVSLIGTGALMIVFRAFRAHRQFFGVVVIGLLASSAIVLWLILSNRDTLASGIGRSGDLTGRTALWDDLVPAARKHLFQGYGWGGFWNGEDSPAGKIWIEHDWKPPDAHNLLLQLALDLGLVGVFLYVVSFLRGLGRGVVFLRDSADPIAMLPVVWFTFELLNSITEHGNLGRSGFWVLHVIFIIAVGLNAKRGKVARSAPRPSRQQTLRYARQDATAFANGVSPDTPR